jgi:hypothetical protein
MLAAYHALEFVEAKIRAAKICRFGLFDQQADGLRDLLRAISMAPGASLLPDFISDAGKFVGVRYR